MKKTISEDIYKFAESFENYLEEEYPSLTLEQRADMGRKLLDFMESK